MGDILFRVPGFKTLLKLTDNPQDPDQIEFAVWEWLQTSMNGKTLYDKLEMWDGGYIRVNRDDDEAGTILSIFFFGDNGVCLLYTSPSPRDVEESRMPSSA